MMSIKRFNVAMVLVLMVASIALGGTVKWATQGGKAIGSTFGFDDAKVAKGSWQAITENPVYPRVNICPVKIDADSNKYLYLKMTTTNRDNMIAFFSPDTDVKIYKKWAVGLTGIVNDGKEHVYRIDMTGLNGWQGRIQSVMLELGGHYRGDTVLVSALGTSSQAIDKIGGTDVVVMEKAPIIKHHDRMAIWQDVSVRSNDTIPNSAFMSYCIDRPSFLDGVVLAKIIPGIKVGGKTVWSKDAVRLEAVDKFGSVESVFEIEGVTVTTRFTVLMEGRETHDWEGAAVYEIETDPATPVSLKVGGGKVFNVSFNTSNGGWIMGDEIAYEGTKCNIKKNQAFIKATSHSSLVGIETSAKMKKGSAQKGEYLTLDFSNGSGKIQMVNAKNKSRVKELLVKDADAEVSAVVDYYDTLLTECKIETPEKVINEGFASAAVLLDYSWYWPYGWMESPHHWMATFHIQHTPAAELLGQSDRSVDCLMAMAKDQLDSGEMPNFFPGGQRMAGIFGGSNQYYFWQVREHYRYTGDIETLKKLATVLDESLACVTGWYNADGDDLFGWGLQVGNQEDMIVTPYNGTTATIEAINMMETRAMVAIALGDKKTAALMSVKATRMRAALKDELWLSDLGRFAYYKDPTGYTALEGPYQTFIYPVIWGMLDELDSYTSMRHLRDRLMGPDGNVFTSNTFGNHLLDIWCTWGMQTGEAQQPWGAWGLGKVGLRNETYLPLKAAAQWAQEYPQLGTWPEVAYENRVGYFSVPPALYIQAVVEALYGLQVDKPSDTMVVSPSFPDHWPEAKITLPKYSADYSRKGNLLTYTVETKEILAKQLRWKLEPCKVEYVKVNGRKVKFTANPSVDCVNLEVDVAAGTQAKFEIKIKPTKFKLDYPASVAQGDIFELKASGVKIVGIDDRCGVLSQSIVKDGKVLNATISDSLLDNYLKFGPLGQMNFSKRTFFVLCQPKKGTAFYAPVNLMILPETAAASTAKLAVEKNALTAKLLVRNNAAVSLIGNAFLRAFGVEAPFDVSIDPRSEKEFNVSLAGADTALISVGDNAAQLLLPNGDTLEMTLKVADLPKSLKAEIVQIPLPQSAIVPDIKSSWVRATGEYSGLYAPGASADFAEVNEYAAPGQMLMEYIGATELIEVPQLPGVGFKVGPEYAMVSNRDGKTSTVIPMDSKEYKKIYILIVSFVDNHDTFSEVGRIDVKINAPHSRMMGQVVKSRTLTTPGDVDYYWRENYMVRIGTHKGNRETAPALIPLLSKSEGDWAIAQPPIFPQASLWADSIAVDLSNSTLNVIEIDLGKRVNVKEIDFQALGLDPAFGIVAVTAEK